MDNSLKQVENRYGKEIIVTGQQCIQIKCKKHDFDIFPFTL